MTVNQQTDCGRETEDGRDLDDRVRDLCAWYGDGSNGTSPTATQWRQVLNRPADSPVTLINFFKLRAEADYAGLDAPAPGGGIAGGTVTGQEAFGRYAAVSMPTMEQVGGRFLHVGPFEGLFLGGGDVAEDWDLVAIGSYPDIAALMALYSDPGYRAAFPHRTAACARQKVVVCSQ